jgi:hypothetical protein
VTAIQDGGLDAFCAGLEARNDSVLVIGCFALLHAGTISFLSQVGSMHKTINVVILPDAGNMDSDIADAGALLKRDERRRILGAMENIGGDVVVLDDVGQLKQIVEAGGGGAKWFCNAGEGDVGEGVRQILSDAGAELQCLSPENILSTRDLLKRMRG